MAFNSTIALGGGAAQSGTAASGSYAMAGCDMCGAEAITLYRGVSPLCFSCDVHVRESAEAEEHEQEDICGPCDDCGVNEARCLFLHLDGRRFHLCSMCWSAADHEPDYLMFCECRIPEAEKSSDYCGHCFFKIPSEQVGWEEGYEAEGTAFDFLDDEDEVESSCDCPVPCLEFKGDEVCFFCKGRV